MSDNPDWSNFLRQMSDLGLFDQISPGCAHRIADALDAAEQDRDQLQAALDQAQARITELVNELSEAKKQINDLETERDKLLENS